MFYMTGSLEDMSKMWLFIGILVVLASCGGGNNQGRAAEGPARLLPPAPAEWREAGETLTFSDVALSNYINGGAEAYFAYGFKRVAVREFRSASDARLTVEIYEMDRPENAYGIYSTDSAGEHWPVGADASYGDGLLRFWKGPYFVRIMCFPPDSSVETLIREIGAGIADAIVAESRRPNIVKLLPEGAYVPDTACYFHRQTSLNNIRFLSDENLLHLGDDVDALTWEQEVSDPKGKRSRLRHIVIRYPSQSSASAAFDDFTTKYLRAENVSTTEARVRTPLVGRLSNERYAAAGLEGEWVLFILDADSPESAAKALAQTDARLDAFIRQPKGK